MRHGMHLGGVDEEGAELGGARAAHARQARLAVELVLACHSPSPFPLPFPRLRLAFLQTPPSTLHLYRSLSIHGRAFLTRSWNHYSF